MPNLHSEAVKNGLFKSNTICYERIFSKYNLPKPIVDSLNKEYQVKRKQIKNKFKELALGDTIRVPYSGAWRADGTNRTTLQLYSSSVDEKDFKCIIKGVVTDKDKRKGGYNVVYKVIDCKDCHYDNIVLNGKELKVGDTIEYNIKFYKILIDK